MTIVDPKLKCSRCWATDDFDKEFAISTIRGRWLNHYEVVCDSRKIFLPHNYENSHCVCELENDLFVLGTDKDISPCSADSSRDSSEFLILEKTKGWEQEIVNVVKDNSGLGQRLEILWLTALFVGSVSRIQFKLLPSPLHLCIALLFKMKSVTIYSDWIKNREKVLHQWKLVEEIIPRELAIIGRRNLLEYLCERELSNVNQLDISKHSPIQHIEDPLLKQNLGGSWFVLGSISMEMMNNKRTLNLGDCAWVDTIGVVFNNWASIHQDATDNKHKDGYFYYKSTEFSMSEDLHSLIYFSLKLSGPAIRSVLSQMDLCDLNSHFKFSENYFHCYAEGSEPISEPNEISSRLNKLYGRITKEALSSYDIYCYCLIREKHSNSKDYPWQQPNIDSLQAALIDCLGIKASELYLAKITKCVDYNLIFQRQLITASYLGDHDKITDLSQQYHSLRMSQWSAELNNKLPIGSNLIIVYHIMNWFLDHISNVDKGYIKLMESH